MFNFRTCTGRELPRCRVPLLRTSQLNLRMLRSVRCLHELTGQSIIEIIIDHVEIVMKRRSLGPMVRQLDLRPGSITGLSCLKEKQGYHHYPLLSPRH